MKPASPIIALCCSITALFFTLWILLPAPHTVLWLVAVVVGEWSLFFGLVALTGILLGIMANRRKRSRAGTIAVGAGLLALVFATYPLIISLPLARSNAVDLSFMRYTFGTENRASAKVQTFNYTQIDGDTLQLDAYFPSTPAVNRPALVVVHGGAWSGGQRSDFPRWNEWLTSEGFVVFDVDYQLSPQPNWQEATENVQQAVRWVKARADTFNIDPTRMALMGRSAGGHLALQAAYTATENRPTENGPTENGPAQNGPTENSVHHNAQVKAVVAFYAPADLRWGYANPANPRVIDGRATLRRFTGGTPNYIPEVYQQASPINHVQESTPATFLVHGRQDQLVRSEQTSRLLEVLLQIQLPPHSTSSPHQALFIPYAQHGFDYNFHGWGSQITQAVLLRHLNKHLAPGG